MIEKKLTLPEKLALELIYAVMSYLSTARYNNARQYLNIDLGTVSRLKRIATQGRYDADQWVTSYAVSYSINNVRFIPYREGRRIKVK